jgi:putative pyruvate formate lyase activating enzyme
MSEPLWRYHSILKGQRRPSFQDSKSILAHCSADAGLEELWKEHSRALRSRRGRNSASKKSLLDLKLAIVSRMMASCELCERRCRADRESGNQGRCGVLEARIASHFMHHGEEEPLVPSYTIFFAGCNFECVFCQNCDISTTPEAGRHIPYDLMARRLENLSEVGSAGFKVTLVREWTERARNVNWVGGEPTPNLAYILRVLAETKSNLPQIWNSNMYMSEESMSLLEGTVDVFLADLKYGNDDCARRYSKVDDYFRVVARNHRISAGYADLVVRHLMLPGHLECCTIPVLEWLARNVPDAVVNIMNQYRPMHMASHYPELMARVTQKDHQLALRRAQELGICLV